MYAPRNSDNVEDKSRLIFPNCKRKGHSKDACFEIIGYPTWWGERGGKAQRGRGHGGAVRANATYVTRSEGQSAEAAKNGFTRLNNEQWKMLIQILDTQGKGASTSRLNGKSEYLEWILDTGASNHMTGSSNFLDNLTSILSCNVGLPNGTNTVATKKGTVVFDYDFSLKNVLLVPDLRCNLISVSQLIKESDCVMQIANIGCAIQDRTLKSLI